MKQQRDMEAKQKVKKQAAAKGMNEDQVKREMLVQDARARGKIRNYAKRDESPGKDLEEEIDFVQQRIPIRNLDSMPNIAEYQEERIQPTQLMFGQ